MGLTLSLNDICSSKLQFQAGEHVSEAHLINGKIFRAERDHKLVGEQLIRAFPLPKSGKFDDLLSAIDDEHKIRRT